MLFFRVILAPHPRRPFIARRFTLPVNVLTDRCPRTIEAPVMERISRQPRASRGVGLVLLQAVFLLRGVLTSLRCFIFSKSFICNIYAPARPSVANKRLTRSLNPLDATFTRNRGGYSSEDFQLGWDRRRRICLGLDFQSSAGIALRSCRRRCK